MGFLSGKRLTALGLALIAVAAAAAVRVALSGDLRPAERARVEAGGAAARADELLARARAAEGKGDVAGALSRYRMAVSLRPQLVDRRSSEYLGAAFETSLTRWVAGLRDGTIPAGPAALGDASYLFRRMYGGCG